MLNYILVLTIYLPTKTSENSDFFPWVFYFYIMLITNTYYCLIYSLIKSFQCSFFTYNMQVYIVLSSHLPSGVEKHLHLYVVSSQTSHAQVKIARKLQNKTNYAYYYCSQNNRLIGTAGRGYQKHGVGQVHGKNDLQIRKKKHEK